MRKLLLAATLLSTAAHAQTAGPFATSTGALGAAINSAMTTKCDLSASACNVTTSGATLSRTLADKLSDIRTPADFLGSGQTSTQLLVGAIDAAPAIQAAMAVGVYVPCGVYRLNTPLVVTDNNQSLLGNGAGCVRMQVTFPTGDVITDNGKGNFHLSGVQFLTTVARTSGALLHLSAAGSTVLEDIKAEASGSGATWFDILNVDAGSAVTHLSTFYFATASAKCIRVTGYSIDTHIGPGNTSACGDAFFADSASGINLKQVDLVGSSGSGVHIKPAAGQSVNALRGSNVLSDTSAGPGFWFEGAGSITEIDISEAWASASGTSNVFTSSQTLNQPSGGFVFNAVNLNGAIFSGARAKGNGGHGFDIQVGTNISFSVPQALMNGAATGAVPPTGGAANSTHYNGINIGTQATNLVFVGPIAGLGGWELAAGLPQKQWYGIARPTAGTSGAVITVIGGQFNANAGNTCSIASVSGDTITVLPAC